MEVKIAQSWKNVLRDEFAKPYFQELVEFVKREYQTETVYPPAGMIFKAFDLCPFDKVKVVILGQDPYHGPGQAHGLSFSVQDGIRLPPSLLNIYKEIKSDLGLEVPLTGNLERWATQGVLLLNATLTVRAHKAGSHQGKGWEEFTDAVIAKVSEQRENIVFILWGAYAQKKGEMIDKEKHFIIKSPHPSPFSADRGFFGSRPFSKANEYLTKVGKEPVAW